MSKQARCKNWLLKFSFLFDLTRFYSNVNLVQWKNERKREGKETNEWMNECQVPVDFNRTINNNNNKNINKHEKTILTRTFCFAIEYYFLIPLRRKPPKLLYKTLLENSKIHNHRDDFKQTRYVSCLQQKKLINKVYLIEQKVLVVHCFFFLEI